MLCISHIVHHTSYIACEFESFKTKRVILEMLFANKKIKKIIQYKFAKYFWMKIIVLTIHTPRGQVKN